MRLNHLLASLRQPLFVIATGRFVLPIMILAGTGASLAAQVTTGSFVCVIRDEQGNPLPEVRVTFKSAALFQPRVYSSDARGEVRALLLPVGNYEVEIYKPGYRLALIKDMRVGLGTNLSQNVTLKEGVVIAATRDLDAGVEFAKEGKRHPKGSRK